MTIQFVNRLPSAEQFSELFATTGWNKLYRLSPQELFSAISNSWLVVSAYQDDRLIGFGRVVSDGVLHAMIYDLIVAPPHQREGIGGELLLRLVTSCRDKGIRDIQLFCAKGKRGFYEKKGFRARSEDAPGMEYVPKRGSA